MLYIKNFIVSENGDFMIKKFAVTNGEKFKPDDEINFDFEIEVKSILYIYTCITHIM